MVDLAKAMAALKAADIGCIGFSVLKPDDSSTWVFFGIQPEDRPQAVAIIQDLAADPPIPSSRFWPSSLDELRADLARVKTFVGVPNGS